ncbi:MAG: GNAT family N-acetyltransferase [Planctomycetes bacterium]|nr:GNAT family N-acetyltransferase [Planctomycetota bacterium]
MSIAIRNIEQEDFARIWEMDWSPLIKERDSIYLVIAVDQAPLSFVACDEDTGEWLGVLLCSRSGNGLSCYINHLLVMERARGKGIGSRLVQSLIDQCGVLGVRRIWFFTSERNRVFYERLGFSEDFSFFSPAVYNYVTTEKMALAMSREV